MQHLRGLGAPVKDVARRRGARRSATGTLEESVAAVLAFLDADLAGDAEPPGRRARPGDSSSPGSPALIPRPRNRKAAMKLREDARWSLVVPTSMGVRITPENRQPVHTADRFVLQATSAETNVAAVVSHLGEPTKVLTAFVAGLADGRASSRPTCAGPEHELRGPGAAAGRRLGLPPPVQHRRLRLRRTRPARLPSLFFPFFSPPRNYFLNKKTNKKIGEFFSNDLVAISKINNFNLLNPKFNR